MFLRIVAFLLSLVTGLSGMMGVPHAQSQGLTFDVTFDEMSKEICEEVKDYCGIDAIKIASNLPDLNGSIVLTNRVFHIDTVAFRDKMYAKRDECYKQGEDIKGALYHFIGVYFSGIVKADVVLEPFPRLPGEYEFIVYITYYDSTERFQSNTYYNPETGELHSRNDMGVANLGHNLNIQEMLVYATTNCWMRYFGFCLFYDLVSYTTPFFNYRTRRFKFDYQDKEWMIQIWKGRYLIADGAEVGVYNRSKSKIGTYYDCVSDADRLKISFSVYQGDKLLVSRAEQLHWWANGFKIMKKTCGPNDLTLKCTIEMKDEEMLQAFSQALEHNMWQGYTYTVDGLKVSIVW